ncbi:MAG: sigmaK-factor processing regulatory BofA [Methanosphaera sp. rholeuAM74]|nr:MAG: sigmaK-factor processing regulatory BofA [Methanosphaera sp. rholeuAM74]
MIMTLLVIAIIVILAFASIGILRTSLSVAIKIIAHLLLGWLSLAIINILPGINVPINIITMIISGFGGIWGTILLVILSLL